MRPGTKPCGLLLDDRGSHVGDLGEERLQRCRQRHVREAAERGLLRTLAAGEARAVVALAQVRTQLSPLRALEKPVELAGDRAFGLVARQRPLELLAQCPAGAEDERLHGAD